MTEEHHAELAIATHDAKRPVGWPGSSHVAEQLECLRLVTHHDRVAEGSNEVHGREVAEAGVELTEQRKVVYCQAEDSAASITASVRPSPDGGSGGGDAGSEACGVKKSLTGKKMLDWVNTASSPCSSHARWAAR